MSAPKDEIIKFKPINEGLGLNHFTDGVPLRGKPAAQNQIQDMMSARKKAVAFNFPSPRAPQFSKPVAAEEIVTAPEVTITQVVYAGPMKRLFAWILDVLFITTAFAFIFGGGLQINGVSPAKIAEVWNLQLIGPMILFYGVVYMGYFLILESTWRKTLGKAVFGIRLQTNSGAALLGRTFLFLMSVAPFGLGLFWQLFDSKKRCWHDKMTDTVVVRSLS
jgi:uncharacterized RDD family membrane protein YckC